MPLNVIGPKILTFTGEPSMTGAKGDKRKGHVEEAATVTGAAGAGCSATRGAAFKMFKSSEKVRNAFNNAAGTVNAINKPLKQSNSLLNALKVNYRNFTSDIKSWAKASNMPGFMKAMFTGSLGKVIGGIAAVFVFVTGLGEVINTFANKVNVAAADVK